MNKEAVKPQKSGQKVSNETANLKKLQEDNDETL